MDGRANGGRRRPAGHAVATYSWPSVRSRRGHCRRRRVADVQHPVDRFMARVAFGPVPAEPHVLELRPAVHTDADAIRTIYNYEVEHTTATFDLVPRTLADQERWLADRSGAFAALVAVDETGLVGFASLSPYKERAAYRTSVEDSCTWRGRPTAAASASSCSPPSWPRPLITDFTQCSPGSRPAALHRDGCTNRVASSWLASNDRSAASLAAGWTSR